MKKILSLLLIVTMCILPFNYVRAEKNTTDVTAIATDLLMSALRNKDYFNLPNLQDKPIYICNPINPYNLIDNKLQKENNIEYYLIRTENEFVASITLCYENDEVISAAFNTEISFILNNNNIGNDSFSLIASEGDLYIKTLQSVIKGNHTSEISETSETIALLEFDDMTSVLEDTQVELDNLVKKENIYLPATLDVSPRSSSILTVPYVTQGDYNVCWAAASAALGQYYTGSQFSQYTAYQLATMMGVGNNGAGMAKSRELLSSIFGINTSYSSSQMSASTIVGHINIRRPILVGFSNSSYAHMVVLCGYDDGGTGANMKYYVRDSNTSSYQIVTPISGGKIGIDYYSSTGVMYWNEAAYKS